MSGLIESLLKSIFVKSLVERKCRFASEKTFEACQTTGAGGKLPPGQMTLSAEDTICAERPQRVLARVARLISRSALVRGFAGELGSARIAARSIAFALWGMSAPKSTCVPMSAAAAFLRRF
jgi:hypothetical protein